MAKMLSVGYALGAGFSTDHTCTLYTILVNMCSLYCTLLSMLE